MKNNIKAPRLIIALLAVVGAGAYAATMMRGSVNIKNSQAATGQNVSDRVVATAEMRPVNGMDVYHEYWYSKVNVSIPGVVSEGDYIDILYKNVGILPELKQIEFKGDVIANISVLPGSFSGYRWWDSNMWRNRIDDMNVQESDGYGNNSTVRVLFNKNVEKYQDVNFSIIQEKAGNAHIISLTPFDMKSSISVNGRELTSQVNRVPAVARGDDAYRSTGIQGSQWINTNYNNGRYGAFRYAFWVHISDDRGVKTGDVIELRLDEGSPVRFLDNSVARFGGTGNAFTIPYNKNGIRYQTSIASPRVGFTSRVSDDGKKMEITFGEDFFVTREKSGTHVVYIDNMKVVDRNPDKFDIQKNIVRGVLVDATWRSGQGVEVNGAKLSNTGNIDVASSNASGEYRPKSNIVVSPSKKIEVSGFLCKNDAFEKFTIRTDIEAGSKFEIKPEEILAKLPEGYKILNPEILSGEMGYKDIVLEVQACVPEEKKEESPQISEPQKPADSGQEEISAPHTGFSGEIVGLAMFAVSVLGVITTFLYNKKF